MDTQAYKNEKDMEQHVRILGWLYIGLNVLTILISICMLIFLVGAGAASGEAEAFFGSSIVGVVVAAFIFLFTIPGLLTGWGLLNRKSWSRILAIIFGALNILSFPFGTALAIYTFWLLLPSEASDYFN